MMNALVDDPVNDLLLSLNSALENLAIEERFEMLQLLRTLWGKHKRKLNNHELSLIAQMSEFLNDWPLLWSVSSELADPVSQDMRVQRWQILASWRMGDVERATQLCDGLIEDEPGESAALTAMFQEWKDFVFKQTQGVPMVEAELRLEPLAEHHMSDFFWQYSQDVASSCALPNFDSEDEWLAWMFDQREIEGRRTFVVIHESWGIIGVASMTTIESSGYVYYWIGADFRGQGFGPRALNMLMGHGRLHCSMSHFYAKVYETNMPSITGLKKSGFRQLSLCSHFKTQSIHYFVAGDKIPVEAAQSSLVRLLQHINPSAPLANIVNETKPNTRIGIRRNA